MDGGQLSFGTMMPNKRTLFLIEDCEEIRTLIGFLADIEGFSMQSAENGIEGLQLLEDLNDPPAAILIDVNMPVMNGFDFLRLFRSRDLFPNVPVILMTGEASLPEDKLCKDLGITELIAKPFTLEKAKTVLLRHMTD